MARQREQDPAEGPPRPGFHSDCRSLLLPDSFGFAGRYRGVALALGIELAAAGLLFWALAAFELIRALRSGRLVVRFRAASPGDFVSVLAWGIINEIGGAMLQQPAGLEGLDRRVE